LSSNYTDAIASVGGLPWVASNRPLPGLAAAMVARADGVLLTGGEDVQASLYARGLPPKLRRALGKPDAPRDLFELQLIREVLRQAKPLLAICRGLQLLNVALGGDLLVDIPLQCRGALNHRRMDRKDKIVHDVELTPGSLLSTITGQSVMGVNSSHHQAVGRIAGLLGVAAWSEDGIVEALELAPARKPLSPFLLAVQFHPERLCRQHRPHRVLFESFVSACALLRL